MFVLFILNPLNHLLAQLYYSMYLGNKIQRIFCTVVDMDINQYTIHYLIQFNIIQTE